MIRGLGSRTFVRYAAIQLPGWVIAAAVLYGLLAWEWISVRVALGLWALWIAKDLALYPWLRHAYEAGDPDPSAPLVGRRGRARERIAPRGYVRLGSESWRAELGPGCSPVEAGAEVRVLAVRGLTLVVEEARD